MLSAATFAALFCVVLLVGLVHADTPANCTYDEISGSWTFYIGEGDKEKTVDCSNTTTYEKTLTVSLEFPNVAIDEFGNVGFWTMIYNQGFEVVVHGRKFFAFSKYSCSTRWIPTSYCDQTLPGWSHDVLGHDWTCYYGRKTERLSQKVGPIPVDTCGAWQNKLPGSAGVTEETGPSSHKRTPGSRDAVLYRFDPSLVAAINSVQHSWHAVHYPNFDNATVGQMVAMAGGNHRILSQNPLPSDHRVKSLVDGVKSNELTEKVATLPRFWDWRNVSGVNYVPPVRYQGVCGSCYVFSTIEMAESRLRIMSNNTIKLTFSPQDVVNCSPYSQGCAGGFPYLVGGKYAEDFGFVEESCNVYVDDQSLSCDTPPSCKRHYTTNYEYVGGYYGGCTEELMLRELYNHGPIVAAFQVYDDFYTYRGGIYHYTGLRNRFNPLQPVSHGVLLVGYGVDESSGEKFWIAQNSWGPWWGNRGYFRIRRGTNECAVESLVSKANPIF